MVQVSDMKRELENLKESYARELGSVLQRATDAKANLVTRNVVSSHDAFNLSADCQNLALLAGKIEQTANMVRWMEAV